MQKVCQYEIIARLPTRKITLGGRWPVRFPLAPAIAGERSFWGISRIKPWQMQNMVCKLIKDEKMKEWDREFWLWDMIRFLICIFCILSKLIFWVTSSHRCSSDRFFIRNVIHGHGIGPYHTPMSSGIAGIMKRDLSSKVLGRQNGHHEWWNRSRQWNVSSWMKALCDELKV